MWIWLCCGRVVWGRDVEVNSEGGSCVDNR